MFLTKKGRVHFRVYSTRMVNNVLFLFSGSESREERVANGVGFSFFNCTSSELRGWECPYPVVTFYHYLMFVCFFLSLSFTEQA